MVILLLAAPASSRSVANWAPPRFGMPAAN